MPTCQIQKTQVSDGHCQDLQASEPPERCFGCGSPLRLCAKCRNELVAFPEVEFCRNCLQEALESEKKSFPANGAQLCPCRQRSVRYEQYRLCLHCTVEKYGNGPPGRQQGEDATDAQPRGGRSGSKTRYNRVKPLDDHMIERATKLAIQRGSLTKKVAIQELEIGHAQASPLIQELMRRGVLGARRGPKPYPCLISSVAEAAPAAPEHQPKVSVGELITQRSLESILSNGNGPEEGIDRQLIKLGMEALRERVDCIISLFGQKK